MPVVGNFVKKFNFKNAMRGQDDSVIPLLSFESACSQTGQEQFWDFNARGVNFDSLSALFALQLLKPHNHGNLENLENPALI